MTAAKTVREVLERALRHRIADDGDRDQAVHDLLEGLREALSAGPGWTTQSIPARDLAVGDVVADRRSLLWSVTKAELDDQGAVNVEIVRGTARRTTSFAPAKPVATLLTGQDARALALVADELGATVVGRAVA